MPNWVINHVEVSGSADKIQKFVSECIDTKNENGGPFSFDKVIPMPKSLQIESSTSLRWGVEYLTGTEEEKAEIEKKFANDKERFNKMVELGKQALENKEKYGYTDWYEWSVANWGTKWDASEVSVDESDTNVRMIFQTAWSTPMPVMLEISKKYGLDVSVEYADEDVGGMNCGTYSIEDGKLVEDVQGSFEFACELWGYDPEDFEDYE